MVYVFHYEQCATLKLKLSPVTLLTRLAPRSKVLLSLAIRRIIIMNLNGAENAMDKSATSPPRHQSNSA